MQHEMERIIYGECKGNENEMKKSCLNLETFVLAKKFMLQGDPRIEKPTLQLDCFGVQMV